MPALALLIPAASALIGGLATLAVLRDGTPAKVKPEAVFGEIFEGPTPRNLREVN
jgi:hypothetical protein